MSKSSKTSKSSRTSKSSKTSKSRLAPHDPFRALLWDLDGTIIDSRHDLATAVNRLLADMELPALSLGGVVTHVGKGARNLVAQCLKDAGRSLSEDEFNRALAGFARHYDRCLLDRTRPYRGMKSLLRRLRDSGRLMAVVTNKPERMTWRILEGLDLSSCFQVVLGDLPGRPRKPDPAPLHMALEMMGRGDDPTRAMMIGDSLMDLEAARAAGVPSCGVAWGLVDAEVVRAAGPDWWVEDVRELSALLRGKKKKPADSAKPAGRLGESRPEKPAGRRNGPARQSRPARRAPLIRRSRPIHPRVARAPTRTTPSSAVSRTAFVPQKVWSSSTTPAESLPT